MNALIMQQYRISFLQ